MAFVLELPPLLGDELTQEAERIGVPADQHAQWLLWVGSALLDRTNSTPISDMVRRFLAEHSVDQEQVGRMYEQLVRRVQSSNDNGIDGIIVTSSQDQAVWQAKHVPQAAANSAVGERPATQRPSAMGKYAHLNWSSDDYARRKQEEIDLEDGGAA